MIAASYLLIVLGVTTVSMLSMTMSYMIVVQAGLSDYWFGIYQFFFLFLTTLVGRLKLRFFERNKSKKSLMTLHPVAIIIFDLVMMMSTSSVVWILLGLLLLPIANSHLSCAYFLNAKITQEATRNFARVATSSGWLIGPMLAYGALDIGNNYILLALNLILAIVWLLLSVAVTRNVDMFSDSYTYQHRARVFFRNSFSPVLLCVMVFAGTNGLAMQVLPIVMIKHYQLDTYLTGVAFTLKCASEMLFSFAFSYYLTFLGLKTWALLCVIIGIASHLGYYFSSTGSSFMFFSIFEGIHYGLFGILSLKILPIDCQRGSVSYVNSLMLGGIISTLLFFCATTLANIHIIYLLNASVLAVTGMVLAFFL